MYSPNALKEEKVKKEKTAPRRTGSTYTVVTSTYLVASAMLSVCGGITKHLHPS